MKSPQEGGGVHFLRGKLFSLYGGIQGIGGI